MSTTALYRLSSGEVLKISSAGQLFSDRNQSFFGVLTDPGMPDGMSVRDNLPDGTFGPLRVLGFSKIVILESNLFQNATQSEIDTFSSLNVDDDNAQDADRARDLFNVHPQFRKMLVAMADIIRDEINILRTLHGLPDRTLVQFRTAMINRVQKDD